VVAYSASTQALYAQLERVARANVPVLVQGETGVGKERAVRALHARSGRRGPLVIINCGAIPQNLVETELFGHERGAFTGAHDRHQGVFERANGGTVCLDEVGELSLCAQAALLRVLDTKRFCRVGGVNELQVDVRVIAATHRNLAEMVETQRFRTDLLYRLNACVLSVPPLRSRRDEILPLALHFLRSFAGADCECGVELDPRVGRALEAYDWPGNVRELKNAMERAAALCEEGVVTLEELPVAVRASGPPESGVHHLPRLAPAAPPVTPVKPFREQVRSFQATLIASALRATEGHRGRAAAMLGLPARTFQRKLRELDIDGVN
jgi:DNA-binding NtrC family response regulator